jgi:sensor domain CHASE-containing protein
MKKKCLALYFLFSATFFIFFAASTRAGVISAHFILVSNRDALEDASLLTYLAIVHLPLYCFLLPAFHVRVVLT